MNVELPLKTSMMLKKDDMIEAYIMEEMGR